MVRVGWLMAAAILALVGFDLLVRDWLGWTGWFAIGVGAGIAAAVLGSLAHDALASPRQPLP
jgi:hypothetical protein